MKKSIDFLDSLNIHDDYIIVGCSGGPDSMCLLNLLINENYKVVCAHVNHNIRIESKDEYAFLKKYCREKNIIFEGMELPSNLDKNESFYRQKRYTFYKNLADKYSTRIIMTAHHGDDLIETILMRISRGSHLKGYLGFPKVYFEGKYRIIKPLIYYNKDEILEYLGDYEIPYVHDKTNDEDTYTRNRYRHHILPFLKKENREIHLKYLKYSEELEAAYTYIEKEVKSSMEENYYGDTLIISKFLGLDLYIQKKELELILKSIYKDDIDQIKETHITDILAALLRGKNFTLHLPLGRCVIREYDRLKFTVKAEKTANYKYELGDKLSLDDGSTIEKVSSSEDTSNFTTRLNSKDISLPLIVRSRCTGDTIEIKNLNGVKKVKKVFIDEKIPVTERNVTPIVTDSQNRVIWMPGIKKSKFDINKEGKYDIILKYTKRKENIDEKK